MLRIRFLFIDLNCFHSYVSLLYRRAVRLRRLTGEQRFKSEGEIESEHMTMGEVAQMTLIRPFVLGFTEPIVACWNVYIALVYGEYLYSLMSVHSRLLSRAHSSVQVLIF